MLSIRTAAFLSKPIPPRVTPAITTASQRSLPRPTRPHLHSSCSRDHEEPCSSIPVESLVAFLRNGFAPARRSLMISTTVRERTNWPENNPTNAIAKIQGTSFRFIVRVLLLDFLCSRDSYQDAVTISARAIVNANAPVCVQPLPRVRRSSRLPYGPVLCRAPDSFRADRADRSLRRWLPEEREGVSSLATRPAF